jgi:hypothetical protein
VLQEAPEDEAPGGFLSPFLEQENKNKVTITALATEIFAK